MLAGRTIGTILCRSVLMIRKGKNGSQSIWLAVIPSTGLCYVLRAPLFFFTLTPWSWGPESSAGAVQGAQPLSSTGPALSSQSLEGGSWADSATSRFGEFVSVLVIL
jgi:hypothetical protein